MDLKDIKVLVLGGGSSSEKEVSKKTAKAIYNAIKEDTDAKLLLFDDYKDIINSEDIEKADFIFLGLHGWGGEDGKIQGYLDLLGKKYSGSGVLGSSLSMDKVISKRIVEELKIPTAPWKEVKIYDKAKLRKEIYDFLMIYEKIVIKPSDQGSSVGLFIIDDKNDVEEVVENIYNTNFEYMIMEQYIPGREITVSILIDDVLPIVEIVPTKGVYDYESKYTKGYSSYYCPAKIDPKLTDIIQEKSYEIFQAFRLKDLARVDFRLRDDGSFYFLEVNTIPGMTETSLLPMAAKAKGYSFKDVCLKIIENNLK